MSLAWLVALSQVALAAFGLSPDDRDHDPDPIASRREAVDLVIAHEAGIERHT